MKTIRDSYELGRHRFHTGAGNGSRDYAIACTELDDDPQREAFLKGWNDAWAGSGDNAPRPNPPRKAGAQRVVASMTKRFDLPTAAIEGPNDVLAALVDYIASRPTEVFVVLFVSARNKLVGYDEYTEGSPTGVSIHPQGIFRAALLSGGVAIITAHNHPSGNPEPSVDDTFLWERLDQAGAIMGYAFLDHFVLGARSYYSKADGHASPYPPSILRAVDERDRAAGVTRYPP